MKTIKLFITVTALAIAAIVNAVENPKLNVIPLTANRAVVSAINEKEAVFEISVKTKKDGVLVYYKQTNQPLDNYKKIYDFEALEDGAYVLNLKVNNTVVSREFEVNFDGIRVGDSKMKYAPYFNFDNGNLKFSYLNFDKENLKLKIYKGGELVYKSTLGNDFAVSEGYDLSKLKAVNTASS
ncbi:MAG TPA: hypothetical protein VKA10_09825 [Prolixibacteraceae bacterium]|nr:hypothetical protein [Prolixibacteraceae bacterium]